MSNCIRNQSLITNESLNRQIYDKAEKAGFWSYRFFFWKSKGHFYKWSLPTIS